MMYMVMVMLNTLTVGANLDHSAETCAKKKIFFENKYVLGFPMDTLSFFWIFFKREKATVKFRLFF